MSGEYRAESKRLEQKLADAYGAFRKHLESTPYPSSSEDWAEHDRYRDALINASREWGDYTSGNKHLR
ncbi:hypothetical protein [Pseudomonas sp. NA-150]|uniref:hypothetical protein n=1 Tax=Pseudomonas sp. NA-150 TaxID=3367525 RepID=UPI0037C96FAB